MFWKRLRVNLTGSWPSSWFLKPSSDQFLSAQATALFLCLYALWGLAKCRGVFMMRLSNFGQALGQAAINEDFES